MRAQIGKWGNSTAVRIPREIAAAVRLEEGTPVEIEVSGDVLVIRPVQRRYTLEELLDGMTPEAMQDAFDWGPDVGREIVP